MASIAKGLKQQNPFSFSFTSQRCSLKCVFYWCSITVEWEKPMAGNQFVHTAWIQTTRRQYQIFTFGRGTEIEKWLNSSSRINFYIYFQCHAPVTPHLSWHLRMQFSHITAQKGCPSQSERKNPDKNFTGLSLSSRPKEREQCPDDTMRQRV